MPVFAALGNPPRRVLSSPRIIEEIRAAAPLSDAEQDYARGGDAMRIARYRNTRYWAVIDTEGTLVCLCVYRKGALEVVRRLEARTTA